LARRPKPLRRREFFRFAVPLACQHELGTPGRTLGFVVVVAPAFGVPPAGRLGTPVTTLLGLAPGAVAMPALPVIVPAALAPLPQGRTVPGFMVLAAPDPLTPGMVIVLRPGVRGRGTVGVTGVVMVPVALGIVDRAAMPTGGMKISAGLEPASALPARAETSAALNKDNFMWLFITEDYSRSPRSGHASRRKQVCGLNYCNSRGRHFEACNS
jgi:hypothetical protein